MISCIILAGGKGSRMEYKNKALLKKDGKFFIEIILENVKKIKQIDEILISSNSNELDYLEVNVYSDEIKNIGPMGGFFTVLPKIKNEFAIILPCDLPFLSEKLIEKLINELKIEEWDIIVPKINGRVDYLVGIYSKNIFNSVKKLIEQKKYKIAFLEEGNKVKHVELTENYLEYLRNINTIDNFKEFC